MIQPPPFRYWPGLLLGCVALGLLVGIVGTSAGWPVPPAPPSQPPAAPTVGRPLPELTYHWGERPPSADDVRP